MTKPECPDCGRPMTCGHCEMCSPPIEALKAGKRLVEKERDKLAKFIIDTFTDKRGEIVKLRFHDVKFNLVFSKAGSYRSGDVHQNVQHDLVMRGCARVKTRKTKLVSATDLVAGAHFEIAANVPHLFYFPEDTVMLEWWDGPFSAEYDPEFRKIVEESLK